MEEGKSMEVEGQVWGPDYRRLYTPGAIWRYLEIKLTDLLDTLGLDLSE